MRGIFLSLFMFLLQRLLHIKNASAFDATENIRSKEVQYTPLNNSVTSFSSFICCSIVGIEVWYRISNLSQQRLSAKWINHIIFTDIGDLVVS